ncbi:glycosyl-4,4'-diaponeurosporenoate acyltransferase CrtO family protein [Echinicola rosea]|uniref:glycosyl-4,4'-diaponeurosporenoate acyltransferase CrtO family protein n=1 Tax=Echinicola rosea TaxID=1807691 RepID=UPI0010CA841F|nr:hypothetical protein [Echinicola rosea]
MHFINGIFLALLTHVFSLFCGTFILYRLSPSKMFKRYGRRYLFKGQGGYRKIGLHLFRTLLSIGPLRYLDHHLLYPPKRHAHSLEEAMYLHFAREAEHLFAFLLILVMVVAAFFAANSWAYASFLLFLNFLFNFYPFLHHQSVRLRIDGLMDRPGFQSGDN